VAWSDPLFGYCERDVPGLLAEPLNAASNVAYLLAGIGLFRLQAAMIRRGETVPGEVQSLPWLSVAVATCSLLFHLFATRWSGALDSLAILLWCAVGIYSVVRRGTRLASAWPLAAAIAFAATSFGLSRALPPGLLGGSAAYLPNLVALAAVAVYLRFVGAPAGAGFTGATVLFAAALVVRTADRPLCAAIPSGTHFVWHLMTGWLLWRVGRELTLRRYQRSQTSA
jgi:hypothetical protein